ncbi:hypothetical protein [Parabacteroides sp.]
MKLKNKIFIPLLGLAAFTACSNEEIIDNPEITKSQEVPSALILGADMGTGVAGTKAETRSFDPKDYENVLYAFVFDKEENCIGAAKSAKATVNKGRIDGVVEGIKKSHAYSDLSQSETQTPEFQFGENEVVITGFTMKKGTSKDVTVLLIVNPVEEERVAGLNKCVEDYNIYNLSDFRKDQWSNYQQTMFLGCQEKQENFNPATCSSTACQWFSMTLNAGINYIGDKNNLDVSAVKWYSHPGKLHIPLYRLIARVDLEVKNELPDNADFSVENINVATPFYSFCVPFASVSLSTLLDENKTFEDKCILIKNVEDDQVENSYNINIYPSYLGSGQKINNSFKVHYYTYEQENSPVLTVKGTYTKDGVSKKVTYTYTFSNDPEVQIRRNKMYTVTLSLKTPPSVDGEVIPIGGSVELEIADMVDFGDSNVSFGK